MAMKETATTSTPEVDLNPHSDVPAGKDISAEIPDAPPAADVPVRPFGVFTGTERLAQRLARAATKTS